MPASLPQELIDKVIDAAQDDLESLRTCSCASSSFRRRSQQHIFAHITILPPLTDAEDPTPCQKFYDLLVSSPHLALYVKSLEIMEGRSKMRLFPSVFPSESRKADTEWVVNGRNPLALILPLLCLQRISITMSPPPRLKQFRPSQRPFRMENLSTELRISLLDVFRSSTLTSLNLGRMALTPVDFYFVLDNCRCLKELAVSDFTVQPPMSNNEQRETNTMDAPPTQLESLTLQGTMDSMFLKHLLAPRSPLDLAHLRELILIDVNNDENLEDLMERTRSALHHLSLQYCDDLHPKPPPNLRPIWIASHEPAHQLERITVELMLDDFTTLSDIDWKALDAVLTRPELANVREVTFRARLTLQRFDPAAQAVESSFPKIAANARKQLSATDAKTLLNFEKAQEFLGN
ncbi:hypothetical protein FB451DRAFT_1389921 [Mycena latifolia]|nr:hypothetical protein FB451DRAFT_1389921 [Mycena latifolia]